MRKNKYEYMKVLQGWFCGGWDDLCYYDCKSTGSMERDERKRMKDDLKTYRENDPRAYRIIFRKELMEA